MATTPSIKVHTVTFDGVEAIPVTVEAQVRPGLAGLTVVGLAGGAVREARERVQAALHSLGISLPAKRMTINLAPADLPKDGPHFDLPMAIALLCATGAISRDSADGLLFMGELRLDGTLAATPGTLAASIYAAGAGLEGVFVPRANGAEAAWAGDIDVFAPHSLADIVAHLAGRTVLAPTAVEETAVTLQTPWADFADVKGQHTARRAAKIAAAGGHNLLLIGPPGAGKSMIAQRMPGILPPLTAAEALEISLIHSIAGTLPEGGLVRTRPFRDPHHTASAAAICGGGHKAKPGELSLAHRGVLFLDELPEFPRAVLETLRQPLETGTITVSRAAAHVKYPARVQVVAAMNPCPCGYQGHPHTACSCAPAGVQRYLARLSGPLLDRFDLCLTVPVVDAADLASQTPGEETATMAGHVAAARALQTKRYAGHPCHTNAEADGQLLERTCNLADEGRDLLQKAAQKFNLSARGWQRVIKVSRTIADLEGSDAITRAHVAEALQLRGGLTQTQQA